LVDEPGGRRIHLNATPRLGGIVLYSVTILMLFVFANDLTGFRPILLGSAVIFMCGIMDDIKGIRWYSKFAMQFIAAGLMIYFLQLNYNFENLKIFGICFPYPFSYILLFMFVVGAINSVNLLDGMDGLASGFSLIAFLVLVSLLVLTHNYASAIIAVSFAGGLIGFLKFNASPASIFLGDTGSLTLGYFLVFTSLSFAFNNKIPEKDITFPIILLGLPIIDTFKVMFMRILQGKSPFLPDRNHLHHILLEKKMRQKVIVFFINGFSIFFALSALYYIKYSRSFGMILFALLTCLLILFQLLLHNINTLRIKSMFRILLKNKFVWIKVIPKYFVHLTSIILFVFLISNFPLKAEFDKKILMIVFCSLLLLFVISFINKLKNRGLNEIYVLFNMVVFFLFSNLSFTINSKINSEWISTLGLIAVLLLVLGFLLVRERIFPEKKVFLTGLDLLLILIISSSYLINSMLINVLFTKLSISLISAFLVYLLYKIIIYVDNKYMRPLFYSSFLLSLVTIIVLLLG
jgi:UDP-GlcNAc:undecaprenyl-phosphate GlcNAc-1-phosphate transferase